MSLIIAIVILIILLVFWKKLRSWVSIQLDSLWRAARLLAPSLANFLRDVLKAALKISGAYTLIIAIAFSILMGLMLIALIINIPALTGIVFVLSLSLILFAWLPAGILLSFFGVTKSVMPKLLKTLISWLAFIGFVALTFPELVMFKAMIGIALIGFVALGVTSKVNFLDKMLLPIVTIMALTVTWKYFFPEDFRSSTRYMQSLSKNFITGKDRGSLSNEADAATTYAVVLKDVKVLYLRNASNIDIVSKNLVRGTVVRIVDHRNEVYIYDGQGLVQIQLANNNGSFINGDKYWIEADYVKIAAPKDVVPRDDSLLPAKANKQAEVRVLPKTEIIKDSIFTKGVYFIKVDKQTPFFINIVSSKKCNRFYMESETNNAYFIVLSDGSYVLDEPGSGGNLPYMERPRFRFVADERAVVKLTVN